MRERLRDVRTLRVGAAIAALVLSLGLVVRLSVSLTPWAPETRSPDAAGRAIVLVDDAAGEALFDDVQLAPGEAATRCVRLSAEGTRRPAAVDLAITSRVDPDLGNALTALVERGTGSCDELTSSSVVAQGSASDVLTQLDAEPSSWVPLAEERTDNGYATLYRFTMALADDAGDELQGAGVAFDLEWSATYSAEGDSAAETALAVLVRTTEDSVVPLVVILALAVLYLGVQDRVDRDATKLADAEAVDELVPFASSDRTSSQAPQDADPGTRDPPPVEA